MRVYCHHHHAIPAVLTIRFYRHIITNCSLARLRSQFNGKYGEIRQNKYTCIKDKLFLSFIIFLPPLSVLQSVA